MNRIAATAAARAQAEQTGIPPRIEMRASGAPNPKIREMSDLLSNHTTVEKIGAAIQIINDTFARLGID
jgi:hypothetical protein